MKTLLVAAFSALSYLFLPPAMLWLAWNYLVGLGELSFLQAVGAVVVVRIAGGAFNGNDEFKATLALK